MPQLTFAVSPSDQLLVDVGVVAGSAAVAKALAAGGVAPPDALVRAVIDTGSTATAVTLAVLQQVGAQLAGLPQAKTQGVGGPVSTDLYLATLTIGDRSTPGAPVFIVKDLVVMTWAGDPPVEVVIGRDILLRCALLLDGPAGAFTLTF